MWDFGWGFLTPARCVSRTQELSPALEYDPAAGFAPEIAAAAGLYDDDEIHLDHSGQHTSSMCLIHLCCGTIAERTQTTQVNIQPIADRVAQHLEIISEIFPTNQNSAHGIYD